MVVSQAAMMVHQLSKKEASRHAIMNSPQVSCGCNTLSADYIVTCQMYHVSNFCLSNLLNLQKIICKLLIISMSLKNIH